ncbi:MAG: dUTP diphosphatase [Magnetococcales bacterium]|nr:dUTP diphosphatase [Magnetococcales bacterium]
MNTSPLIVPLKILAHGVGLELPKYETAGSAGMDLRAAVSEDEPITLNPGERAVIPSGLSLAIPLGWEGQVRPRSGLALKKGVTVLNAPGTIDSDYRGELGVILINHGSEPFTVRRGERIAQFLLAQVSQCQWKIVSELGSTQRNDDGFGSTGQ